MLKKIARSILAWTCIVGWIVLVVLAAAAVTARLVEAAIR